MKKFTRKYYFDRKWHPSWFSAYCMFPRCCYLFVSSITSPCLEMKQVVMSNQRITLLCLLVNSCAHDILVQYYLLFPQWSQLVMASGGSFGAFNGHPRTGREWLAASGWMKSRSLWREFSPGVQMQANGSDGSEPELPMSSLISTALCLWSKCAFLRSIWKTHLPVLMSPNLIMDSILSLILVHSHS